MERLAAVALSIASSGCSLLYAPPGENCPPPDEHTVALYPFEDVGGSALAADLAGGHDGVSPEQLLASTAGPPGCGDALAFPETGSPLVIADAAAWDLAEGSVDLWIRLDREPPGEMGILTRDAVGDSLPGHFALLLSGPSGRPVLRIQGRSEPALVVICAEEPLARGRWVHLAVNFGPPAAELYVDGVGQAGSGTIEINSTPIACRRVASAGIAGNRNPWVIGASTEASAEGSHEPLSSPLRGAAVDHVRISSARRAFGAPP